MLEFIQNKPARIVAAICLFSCFLTIYDIARAQDFDVHEDRPLSFGRFVINDNSTEQMITVPAENDGADPSHSNGIILLSDTQCGLYTLSQFNNATPLDIIITPWIGANGTHMPPEGGSGDDFILEDFTVEPSAVQVPPNGSVQVCVGGTLKTVPNDSYPGGSYRVDFTNLIVEDDD